MDFKRKNPLTFQLAEPLNIAGRTGPVWSLVLYINIGIRVNV